MVRYCFLLVGWSFFSLGFMGCSFKAQPDIETDWFSSGERIIFQGSNNLNGDLGVQAFRDAEYKRAFDLFTSAQELSQDNPELQIYLNNSDARRGQERTVLAAVMPISKSQGDAESALRGIADAQTLCNSSRENKIEILIVDDNNDLGRIAQISKSLADPTFSVKNPSFLLGQQVSGIIGHYSSAATKTGLEIYEAYGLPVISPASTSDFLKSDVFFRTAPADRESGKKLANYVHSEDIKNVALFYVSDDPYSDSLRKAFRKEFKDTLKGKITENDFRDIDADASEVINSLEDDFEAIVLFPDTEFDAQAIAMARESRSKNLPTFGGDVLYTPRVLEKNSNVEGLVVVVPWFSSRQNDYAVSSQAKWGGQINWITAMSFDATRAFCEAISENKPQSRSTIAENLKQVIVSEQTSGEEFSFDEEGNVTRLPILVTVVSKIDDPTVNTPSSDTKFGFKPLEP